MALDYILRRFAQKTGVRCYPYQGMEADSEARTFAIDLINSVCKDLYTSRDLKGSLKECDLLVLNKTQFTAPAFVGNLRAARELNTGIPWSLTDIRPRYHRDSWAEDGIQNWRDKGKTCIARDLSNTAPPIVIVPFVEDGLSVTIIGATENSNRVSETKLIDSEEVEFETSFTEYYEITKNKLNKYNVLIQDADEVDLSLIYNDALKAEFTLFDATSVFVNPATVPFPIEIMYKERFKLFDINGDNAQEFQIPDYDEVILNLILEQWHEDKGNVKGAAAFALKAQAQNDIITKDGNKGKDLKVEFQETGQQKMFRNIRQRWGIR